MISNAPIKEPEKFRDKIMWGKLIPYNMVVFVMLIICVSLLIAYPKLELHLLLNSYHTKCQDAFFSHYSVLAEWPLYVLMLVPLLWKKWRMTVFFLLSELVSGTIVQTLKAVISMKRPHKIFESYPDLNLPLVEVVDLYNSNSFPSGHSSTFMVFFTCLAIILACRYQKKKMNPKVKTMLLLLMVVCAFLGGYSRIYLSQHFLLDVFTGSIIGFVMPYVVFHFGDKKLFKLKN